MSERPSDSSERPAGSAKTTPTTTQVPGIFTILFFADIVGRAGRQALSHCLKPLRERFQADCVVVNVENAAAGFGVTPEMSKKIFAYGAQVQTSGNHIWDRQDIIPYIAQEDRLLRPINFPKQAPGRGSILLTIAGEQVAVINAMGRTFMKDIDCPFAVMEKEVTDLSRDAKIIFVDFHAEATSEKQAMKYYLDGRVSAVVGTHTHVQTADAQITRNGTAYITDVGMSGPHDSILGMKVEAALDRFLSGLPRRMTAGDADIRLSGVVVRIDTATGRALAIEPFQEIFELPAGAAIGDDD